MNGKLTVSLINGHTPQTNHNIPIISGTINGTFSNVSLPSGYFLVYKPNGVDVRGAAVLPLTFLSLSAKKATAGVDLVWTVENEDGKQYEVEKSANGINFIKTGVVAASSQKSYRYIDALQDAACFYRIKSVGPSGSIHYSSVVKFSEGTSKVVATIFPNLATTWLVVQHPTSEAKANITIYSVDGKPVLIQALRTGVQQSKLDVARSAKGSYTVKVDNGDLSETLTFIKL